MPDADVLRITDLRTHITTPRGTVRAVDGVSLRVGANEIVGIVGESGSGKSMTALSVMRLLPEGASITAGEIRLGGRDLLALSEPEMEEVRGARVAMIFQDPSSYLNPLMKVGHQVAETFVLHHRLTLGQARKAATDVLRQLRIDEPERVYDYYPFQFSGGMRQRVLIAIALACRPALVIADEPTTALDVITQDEILRLLKQNMRELGSSLLIITHDLSIVADICDRVYVMYAGKVVETADVFELFERPRHPYTVGLHQSILTLTEFKPEITSIGGQVPDMVHPPAGCRFSPRCPQAWALCTQHEPRPMAVGPEHTAACWLHGKEGTDARPA